MRSGSLIIGSEIPEFELMNQFGHKVQVNVASDKFRLIYFYPRNDTPVCTKQACSIRDNFDIFLSHGIEVIGISSDSVESHLNFSKKHKLEFTLLSDSRDRVRKLFGATKLGGLISSRISFLINPEGKVVFSFDSLLSSERHINKIMDVIEKIEEKEA